MQVNKSAQSTKDRFNFVSDSISKGRRALWISVFLHHKIHHLANQLLQGNRHKAAIPLLLIMFNPTVFFPFLHTMLCLCRTFRGSLEELTKNKVSLLSLFSFSYFSFFVKKTVLFYPLKTTYTVMETRPTSL